MQFPGNALPVQAEHGRRLHREGASAIRLRSGAARPGAIMHEPAGVPAALATAADAAGDRGAVRGLVRARRAALGALHPGWRVERYREMR
jgi:hypothetical protein